METRAAIDFVSSNAGQHLNETLINTPEPDRLFGMNVVYNETDVREMMFAVNGRDASGSVKITGHRCLEHCEVDEIIDNDDQDLMYWSDPSSWPNLNGRIPEEGEEVDIMRGYDIIYDIGVSPVFKNVEINGKLTFLQG